MWQPVLHWFRRWSRPASLGARGEALAARYLRQHGHRIVARGDRSRLGEIDLVAVEGRTVVFVEVKTRSSDADGSPAEAVDRQKQTRITKQALAFLKRHDLLDCAVRFDVIAITWPAETRTPALRHFRNAFPAHGQWQMYR